MLFVMVILPMVVLFVYSCVATYFLWKFANIILLFEQDLEEAIEVHERSLVVFENLLTMPMFFDSPEVKKAVSLVMDDIKACKQATQKVAHNFLSRSKNKYIRLIEEEKE